MGILDFLFQGSPPQSVTTYGETTTDLPTWYSDYTQGLISRANAIAAEPYQAYSQPRIAPLDYGQTQAYNKTFGLEGQYKPTMDAAIYSATQGGLGSALGQAQPYFQRAESYNPYTSAAPLLGEASNYLRQQVGDTSALAQPYFGQASSLVGTGTQGTAGLASPFLNLASQQTGQAGQAVAGQAAPYLTTAAQQTGQAGQAVAGLANPYLQQASAGTTVAGMADTAGLASPYMQQAGALAARGAQTGLGGIEEYMNPYQEQVVNRIGELGQRNLRENLLPEIQDRAIAAGQFGGSRQGEAIGRALRDVQESTLAAQSQALQQGYTQAGQQQAADRARQLQAAQQQAQFGQQAAGLSAADYQRLLAASGQQAQIGQSLAGLSAADQQRLLAAAGQQAQIGQSLAGLSAADQQRLLSAAGQQAAIGQSMAGLTGADYQRMLAGAQQQAAMGQAAAGLEGADLARYGQAGSQLGALGQLYGQLSGTTAQQLANLGQQSGALAGQDYTRQLQAAQQLGTLGQLQQSMGLQNIGALEAAGAMQQQQGQRSLDQAYADFLAQREYDRNNIAFLNAAIRGLEIPTSTSTQSTGPASVYQPSPLSQLAQGAASIYGFKKLFGG